MDHLRTSSKVDKAVRDMNEFIRNEFPKVLDAAKLLAPEGSVPPRYAKDYLHLNKEGYAVLNAELNRMLVRYHPRKR